MISLKRTLQAASLTGTVYGFAGWLYIAASATFHPQTLPLQLSHLTPWIREDTFGFLCFGISIISFFVYNLLKE